MADSESFEISTLTEFFSEVAKTDGKDLESLINRVDLRIFDCKIHIVGDGYNGNIPGQLLQGLSEFQNELFRTYAFAVNGKTDLRGISKDDLYISISVEKGSLGLTIGFLAAVAIAKMFDSMTPAQKWATILLIGLGFSTYEITDYFESQQAYKLEMQKLETQAAIAEQQEQAEHDRTAVAQQALTNEKDIAYRAIAALERIALENAKEPKLLHLIERNSDQATSEIVRNAIGATQMTIRQKDLNKEEIKAIQSPESQPVKQSTRSGKFRIVQINTENHELWKLQIKNDQGEKISASAEVFNLFRDPERSKELLDFQKNETLLDIEMTVVERSSGTFYTINRLKETTP